MSEHGHVARAFQHRVVTIAPGESKTPSTVQAMDDETSMAKAPCEEFESLFLRSETT